MFKIKLKEKEVRRFILIFYCIGLLGFIIPFTNNFFKILIPFALITNFFILFYFHKSKQIKKDLIIFLLIFLGGLIIEIIGVNTKIIFGDYAYGAGLGLKILNTPIIIGVNWLFLAYTTTTIVDNIKTNSFFKIILASALMIIYDIVLEQIAPNLDMWSWKNNIIPLQNYIAWFVVAVIFNTLIKVFRVNTKNPLSLIIFCSQFVFFGILLIYFRLIV